MQHTSTATISVVIKELIAKAKAKVFKAKATARQVLKAKAKAFVLQDPHG